ncbi:hypothetical protein AA0119_g12329 [Alternaria tenuissima]|uniref:Uncharacterized protein n=1 Tax=Alternaria tenuissima TaxID=119927 RepID=A0ABY0FU52_9PLEO|nr:hypothetical protein AA0119_g12329 [Alternaria tenuissima]RYO10032.1 hypothetical protein AA0121_g10650 [Alternaria tenuissima]
MSDTDRIDGLLGDLQQLTEAGRGRILGVLPQEDLIALLKVALRERDQDRENVAIQTQLSQSPHAEPTVHVAREEPSNVTNRAHTAVTLRNHKRPRTDSSPTEVVGNNLNSVAIKQEHETIDLVSDDEWENSNIVVQPNNPIKREESPPVQPCSRVGSVSAPIISPNLERTQTIEPPEVQTSSGSSSRNSLATSSRQSSAVQDSIGGNGYGMLLPSHPVGEGSTQARFVHTTAADYHGHLNLPVCLLIRGVDGKQVYKTFMELPNDIQQNIHCRFAEVWRSQPWILDNYEKLLQNPEHYMTMPACIRSLIVSKNTRLSSRSLYTMGGSLKETADDQCIRGGHPCAHFVKLADGTMNICFVPLPPGRRVGNVWTELSYWTDANNRRSSTPLRWQTHKTNKDFERQVK